MARLLRKAKPSEVLKPSDETEVLILENLELRRIVADLLIQTTILREQLQSMQADIDRQAKRVA
jgi:hypothetical protein